MKRTAKALILTALLAPALTACNAEPGAAPTFSVRDSAGVRIVENSAPFAGDSAWQVSELPFVNIGTTDDDSTRTLYNVAGATRLSDGRIVIANGPPPMLRWFDSTGTFLYGTGRGGGGPGEFPGSEGAWIAAIWPLPGDSIGTWHHESRRLQVFRDGGFIRAVTFDLPKDMPERAYPQFLGPLQSGVVAMLVPPFRTERTGIQRDSNAYLHYRGDGVGAIARRPGLMRVAVELQRRGMTFRTELSPVFGAAGFGQTHGDELYYTAATRFEFEVMDTTGAVRTIVRRNVPAKPVTAELLEAYRARARETGARNSQITERQRIEGERRLASMPSADSVPHIGRMLIDREGLVWLREYNLPGSTALRWFVFDREGRWITTVRLPPGLTVYEIGRDYLLGLTRDDLEVEHVVLHRLNRTAPPR